MSPQLHKAEQDIHIPALDANTLESTYVADGKSVFCDIDANIPAWLPPRIPKTESTAAAAYDLQQHLNNKELIEEFGGEERILEESTLTLGQVHYLLRNHQNSLLTNGFANLFFVNAEGQLHILNAKYEADEGKFIPYVYRIHNLYRSWSKSNKIFVREDCKDQIQTQMITANSPPRLCCIQIKHSKNNHKP